MAGNNKWNDAYTGMQRNGKTTETETEKDTEIGTGLVYHMDKKDPQIVRGYVITGGTKVDPQATGNIVQPLSAQVNAPSATSTLQGETDWAAAYRDRQKGAAARSAKTLAQQSYFDMQKSAEAKSAQTGGSPLDLGRGPITQDNAEEISRAQGNEDTLEISDKLEKLISTKGTEAIFALDKEVEGFPDFTDKLTKYLEEVVKECKTAKDEQGIFALMDWIDKVKPDGI